LGRRAVPRRPRPAWQTGRGRNAWEPRCTADIKKAKDAIMEGATLESVCFPHLGAGYDTVRDYMKRFPESELTMSIMEAQELSNVEDEQTLKRMSRRNYQALRLRLINRTRPGTWRDKMEITGTPEGLGRKIPSLTPDDVARAIETFKKTTRNG
jgi:hypothetical protein